MSEKGVTRNKSFQVQGRERLQSLEYRHFSPSVKKLGLGREMINLTISINQYINIKNDKDYYVLYSDNFDSQF